MFANLGIAVTKFVAFLLTASSSMLAESVHSLADTSNQALLLLGGNRAKRAATPEHPFGYGRERYVYAFIVSIVLFSIGGLFALYEAWHKWSDPHPIDSWQWVPIVVLLVAMAMEGYALRTAVVESNRVRADRSWKEFVRTAKAPELPVILLEDCGALLGLMFALFGVSMTLLTGEGRWDAAGTAMIGILLVLIAVILAVEMKSLLIGESASRAHQRAIQNALAGRGGGVDHPYEDAAPRARRIAGRGQDRGECDGHRRAGGQGHRCRRAPGAFRRPDRPGHLPRTGPASAHQGTRRAHRVDAVGRYTRYLPRGRRVG